MVTGQRLMALTTNKNNTTPKALSILVSLDGLSFCVLSFGKIVSITATTFERQLNPSELLERLKRSLTKEGLLKTTFQNVYLCISNDLFTCVPNALYQKDNLTNYLKFSTKLLSTDFADVDDVDAFELKTIYIPFTNITNFIYDTFGDFTYKHSVSVLCEAASNLEETSFVLINVTDTYYELIAIKEGQMQLTNRFSYKTKEDFMYYLLFVYEQLDFDRDSIHLHIAGAINDDDARYEIAFKYIRHVALRSYSGYDVDPSLEELPHNNLLLKQALL